MYTSFTYLITYVIAYLLRSVGVLLRKVDREKQQCDELLTRSTADRTSLDQSLRRLEHENTELQRQLQALQTQLVHTEHDHTNKYVHTHIDRYI